MAEVFSSLAEFLLPTEVMRFNFKWMVAIGLVLGIASVWWELSSSKKDLWGADESLDPSIVAARARENNQVPTTAASSTVVPVPTWQPALSQVLTSGASTADKAKNLLAQFPNLPPAGQFEAAHHISNLLPDDAYGSWAGYLTNASIPAAVQGVMYADLLRRPNSIRLPMLLQLARSSSSKADDAGQSLRATLREDYGTDWNAWSLRIQEWLKANPDPASPGSSGMTVGN